MKLIKLDKRHTFYKDGFRFAFSGSCTDNRRFAIERYLNRAYGDHQFNRKHDWFGGFTNHKRRVPSVSGGTYLSSAYYIALRYESDVTACLLAVRE